MIKALIIEDEIHAIDLLSEILSKYCKNISLLGTASDFESSVALINEVDVDLVFMDIQLKDCISFDILDAIDEKSFEIVFTTAYNSYAIKAFEYGAMHYLLKPYSPASVVEAVDRVAQRESADVNSLKEVLATFAKPAERFISIKTNEGIYRVEVKAIVRVEADRSYCTVELNNGKSIITSKPLKEIEELLKGYSFFRTHQSHLINLDFVKQYLHEDGGIVLLSNGFRVPLSRRRKNDFIALLN